MAQQPLIQDIFIDTPPAYANSLSTKMANRGHTELLGQRHGELLRLYTPISPNTHAGPLVTDIRVLAAANGRNVLKFADEKEIATSQTKRLKLSLTRLFH